MLINKLIFLCLVLIFCLSFISLQSFYVMDLFTDSPNLYLCSPGFLDLLQTYQTIKIYLQTCKNLDFSPSQQLNLFWLRGESTHSHLSEKLEIHLSSSFCEYLYYLLPGLLKCMCINITSNRKMTFHNKIIQQDR